MKKALDSHALMVFLEKEPGYEKVQALLVQAAEHDQPLFLSVVNWAEIHYIVLREIGEEKAQEIERVIEALPIELVDVDQTLAREAAIFKAFKKMSFADCFAAALTKSRKAQLITGDREFKAVEDELNILWI
jgi:predicted nucleic acid-binding protein